MIKAAPMQNPLRALKALSLFVWLLGQPLWAAVPITWFPEAKVAVVRMDSGAGEDRGMQESFRTMGPISDLPEGYFVLVAPAGEAALGSGGQIIRTSLSLGDRSTDNVTELIEPLIAAGVPLTKMKGMVLVTCYGGRPLPDGTPSLAKKMAQVFSFPVLATTGEITQAMALEIDVSSSQVQPSSFAYSQYTPSGATRVSPWVIETPTAVTSEQVQVLQKAQSTLDKMQLAASTLGLLPGDLRPREVSAVTARFPNVVGMVGGRWVQYAAKREWERFKLSLEDRKISAVVINPLIPEIQLGMIEYGIQQMGAAIAPGNGVVVPVVSRWWFVREKSLPQYIADTTRLIVFHPSVPENAESLSDEEFLNAVDFKNWVALRPAATRLPYFDDEVEGLKSELAKSLGESKVRPFSQIEWANCHDSILGARLSQWRRLLPWNFFRKKS